MATGIHKPKAAEHLKSLKWDIATLQEVPRDYINIHFKNCDTAFSLDLLPGGYRDQSSGKTVKHGTAILCRNGYWIDDMSLVPKATNAKSPKGKPEFAISAKVSGQADLTVISVHIPNGADYPVPLKQDCYRSLVELLSRTTGPIVIGMDANSWDNSEVKLPPTPTPRPAGSSDHPHYQDRLFFSSEPSHKMRDAYYDIMQREPERYAAIISENPYGPLAVSHKRRGTPDRFDRMMVSPDVTVDSCDYDYESGKRGGSDHGTVIADLQISA